jgi:hypothetical protein
MIIPIGITAKNEAANILRNIESIETAISFAESRLPVKYQLSVLLNDNSDNTPELLQLKNINTITTFGGIVEAQRIFAAQNPEAPFLIFSDADIIVSISAVFEVTKAFLEDPAIEIAYAEKVPLRPISKTFLAKALYLYNLNNGYQSDRHYFNGQFFGIRTWYVPKPNEIDYEKFKDSNFLNLSQGVRCDDIYLSRKVFQNHGPGAIKLVNAQISYRPPESLKGMYRKYQRMCLEIERLDILFPKSEVTHQKWGRRKFVFSKFWTRSFFEKTAYAWFVTNLYLCKAFYSLEKFYYTYISFVPCQTWLPVTETKREIG